MVTENSGGSRMKFRTLAARSGNVAFSGVARSADRLNLRSFMLGVAAIVLLALAITSGAVAQSAGPIISLSDADRAQLDALLGSGVVGEALPSAPLGDPSAY